MIREKIIKEIIRGTLDVAIDKVIPTAVASKDLFFLYREKKKCEKEIKKILVFIGKVAYDNDIPIKKNNKVICNELKRIEQYKNELSKIQNKIDLTTKDLCANFKYKSKDKMESKKEH